MKCLGPHCTEALLKHGYLSSNAKSDVCHFAADITKAKDTLGYKPEVRLAKELKVAAEIKYN